jgi:hypothetical protein
MHDTSSHRNLLWTLLIAGCGSTGEPVELSQSQEALTISPTTVYQIKSAATGKCIGIVANSTANSANVEERTCNGATGQNFTIPTVATGYYAIKNTTSLKCLDVTGKSTADGAAIIQYTCNSSSTNQQWAITEVSAGVVRFTARHSGKVAEVNLGGTADGTAVVQRTWNGATYQKFLLSSGTGGTGGTKATGGTTSTGGTKATGGTTSTGGTTDTGGTTNTGGTTGESTTGGIPATGGTTATGGTPATGGSSSGGSTGTGPFGVLSGPLDTGIIFMDTDGVRVNAHGGGILKVGDTFYMHGEYFPPGTTDNNFHGFTMYSSKDLATWKNQGIILPQQASGELGPNRKGERPHIIKCPATGEFVLYAHAADVTYQKDKEVVYATSPTVNGQYSYKGPLKNASGQVAAHSDMGAFADDTVAYVITESAHVYTLASNCHSWLSDKSYSAINGNSGGSESPAVFKANGTYYWIGSYKTGWRANNNFYSTAPAMTGPWTYQGYVAPVTDPNNNISDQRTWMSQSTWVQPIAGSQGTVFVYWGDHWYGNQDTTSPGLHNDLAGYVFQPLVFNGAKISLPTYLTTWNLDVGAGTWSL